MPTLLREKVAKARTRLMAVKPLVSVIIPTFNRLEFLKEAVESVEKQSSRDFELIIVDDGSTDGTGGYLESLPVKYIRLEHSGFPGQTDRLPISLPKNRDMPHTRSVDQECQGGFPVKAAS